MKLTEVLHAKTAGTKHASEIMLNKNIKVRRPGIEPGPPAWKAGIITIRLTAHTLRGSACHSLGARPMIHAKQIRLRHYIIPRKLPCFVFGCSFFREVAKV